MHESDWREWSRHLPTFAAAIPLDAVRTALLIVDMQATAATRAGGSGRLLHRHYPDLYPYYFGRLEQVVIPKTRHLLRFFRKNGLRVIFLRVGSHFDDGTDLEPNRRARESQFETSHGVRPAFASLKRKETQILEALRPRPSELVVEKVSRSAFTSTGLDQLLRNMEIGSLAIAGVATDACVLATAIDAADRGYRSVLVEDATATIAPVLHNAALLIFSHLYGRVLSTEALLSELQATRSRPRRSARQSSRTRHLAGSKSSVL